MGKIRLTSIEKSGRANVISVYDPNPINVKGFFNIEESLKQF